MAIGNLWHPERYQGARRRYPYFEGWYFKLVDASERHRYAVIPGVSKGPTLTASQAFVQFLDGSTGQAIFVRYPFTEFHASSEAFSIQVDPTGSPGMRLCWLWMGPSSLCQGRLACWVARPGRGAGTRLASLEGSPLCHLCSAIMASSV